MIRQLHWARSNWAIGRINKFFLLLNYEFDGMYELREFTEEELENIPDVKPDDLIKIIKFIESLKVDKPMVNPRKNANIIDKRPGIYKR